MADISRLSRLVNGVMRGVDLATNELVVNQLRVGGASGTYLTQTILDKLILTNTATDADGTFDLRYADIAIEAVANAALPEADFTDAAVTGKLLTGYSSSAGLVAAGDTLLVGINKLNGNQVLSKATADAALPLADFTAAAVTGKLITGFSSTTGAVQATDSILVALNKLDGNLAASKVGAIIYKSTFNANAAAAAVKASVVYVAATFEAVTAGANGNNIALVFNGTDDEVKVIVDAWNLANGSNQVSFSGVPDDYVPPLAGTATLINGADAVGSFDAINNPKQGWLYKVGTAGTIGGTLFSVNDNMYINKDVTGHPVLADIDLIDNTEAADILRKGQLTSGQIFVGSASNEATAVSMSSEATMVASGAVTLSNSAVIAKVLTGYSQGAGSITNADSILSAIQKAAGNAAAAQGTANDALPEADFTDAAVTGKLITGFSSSAGAIQATDSILVALNKLDGNISAAVAGSVAMKEEMTCGEAFASGLFAVRFAKAADAGYVAGRIYKADLDATTVDNFHVCGLMTSAGKSAADKVDVIKSGKMTVTSHGFTVGQPLFLSAAGAITQSAPTTANYAVKQIGMVRDANTIEVQILSAYVN
jgi:hypothetical protein